MAVKIITKTKFIKALEDSGGILSVIARKLKVTRKAVYNFIDKYPELKELIDQERETILDIAQNTVYDRVKGEDWEATRYLLNTLGRQRGFSSRTEETEQIDHNINISFVDGGINIPLEKKNEE